MKIKKFLSLFFSVSDDKGSHNVVIWICWMHFFWGMASSMGFSLLPVFIVDKLGGNSRSFGLLEGSVILLSFTAKLFSGIIMDMFKKKLPIFKAGSILTIFSKVFLTSAPNVLFVFIAKSIDRFAKGLRQGPSDAILAELAAKKGLAYSLRHMMNLSGFFVGSIITSAIVYLLGQNFRLIFAIAIIPSSIALYIFQYKIKYDDVPPNEENEKQKWNIRDITKMPKEYWSFTIVIVLLMFNRFSEGFITLRAKEVLPEYVGSFPIFMSFYEICAILVSIPIGKISDKFDKRKMLLCGICIIMLADIFGMFANNLLTIILIYIFAGIHIGATQGLIGSMIAKTAQKHLIGTAFAIYYGIDGITLFLANNLAGISSSLAKVVGLQDSAGPFIFGFISSSLAVLYILKWIKRKTLSA
ncbi:MAG: MFS transporter [Holosporales bacterium]|jgi:MFS family permease|nr:MFS transporter [Holosporales bacterium]